MYIISLSETWHPFIRFLEKNNLSCFFLWIFFWVTKSKCFKFSIWQWQGAFSPKLPGTLGVGEWFADSLTQTWIMVCKSDLVNHLQFFFELLPPPPPRFYHWTLWHAAETWEDIYCLALASGAVSVLFEAIPEGGVFGSRGDLWEPAPWVKSKEVPSGKETHNFFKNEVYVHLYHDDYES